MNVKELIEMLKTFPPDATVWTNNDDGNLDLLYKHEIKLDSDGDLRLA